MPALVAVCSFVFFIVPNMERFVLKVKNIVALCCFFCWKQELIVMRELLAAKAVELPN